MYYIGRMLKNIYFAVPMHTAGRMYRQIKHVHTANEKILLRAPTLNDVH